MPIQNTIVTQWVIFGISIAIAIGSVVAQFLGAGNYTPAAIVSAVIAVLMAVLTQITKSDQRAIQAQLRRLKK